MMARKHVNKRTIFGGTIATLAVATIAARLVYSSDAAIPPPAPPVPQVVVSKPLAREVDSRLGFLGQFSAIEQVELRAQVGGTLTGIHFKDGDIVHKGDLLFTIDARPFEIRLAQANAQLETASARLALAERELNRAQVLATKSFGTEQTVDQRTAEQRSAQAAVDDAKAQIRSQSSISSIAASLRPSLGASARTSSRSAI
jgi:multidrug efflux pump subunit AcrA (membrane-fusion protein)